VGGRTKGRQAARRFAPGRLRGGIRYVDGKLVLDKDKAKPVRRVFALAAEGLGAHKIAMRLNALGVPVLGRTTFKHRRWDKPRAVLWSEMTVYYVLNSRAVFGEFQPGRGRAGNREPVGDAVPSYFPAVISREEFDAVQVVLKTRAKVGRGRRGKHCNLFAGLLRDARTGGSLSACHTKRRSPTLFPVGSKQGRNEKWVSYPLQLFEQGVLSALDEVKLAEVLP